MKILVTISLLFSGFNCFAYDFRQDNLSMPVFTKSPYQEQYLSDQYDSKFSVDTLPYETLEVASTLIFKYFIPDDYSLAFDYQNRKNSESPIKEERFLLHFSKKF